MLKHRGVSNRDKFNLRHNVTGDGAGRVGANVGAGVGAEGWTRGYTASGVQLDVRRQVVRKVNRSPSELMRLQSKLIGRRVNLAEVIDASVGLRGGARFYEVRNGNGREQADDGHHDHDFHEREACFPHLFSLFHCICITFFFIFVVEQSAQPAGLIYDYMITFCCPLDCRL